MESNAEKAAFTALSTLSEGVGCHRPSIPPTAFRSPPPTAVHFSKLSVLWRRLGISIEPIKPGHPHQNGRRERRKPHSLPMPISYGSRPGSTMSSKSTSLAVQDGGRLRKPNARIWRSAFWSMRPSGHFHKVWMTAAKASVTEVMAGEFTLSPPSLNDAPLLIPDSRRPYRRTRLKS